MAWTGTIYKWKKDGCKKHKLKFHTA